jgi:hypothetical protein
LFGGSDAGFVSTEFGVSLQDALGIGLDFRASFRDALVDLLEVQKVRNRWMHAREV